MTAEDEARCRGCGYAAPVEIGGAEAMMICTYRLRNGKKRPCGPGRACTVYEEKETKT